MTKSEEAKKIALVKKIMDNALLAIEAKMLEAEWQYWSEMVELGKGKQK